MHNAVSNSIVTLIYQSALNLLREKHAETRSEFQSSVFSKSLDNPSTHVVIGIADLGHIEVITHPEETIFATEIIYVPYISRNKKEIEMTSVGCWKWTLSELSKIDATPEGSILYRQFWHLVSHKFTPPQCKPYCRTCNMNGDETIATCDLEDGGKPACKNHAVNEVKDTNGFNFDPPTDAVIIPDVALPLEPIPTVPTVQPTVAPTVVPKDIFNIPNVEIPEVFENVCIACLQYGKKTICTGKSCGSEALHRALRMKADTAAAMVNVNVQPKARKFYTPDDEDDYEDEHFGFAKNTVNQQPACYADGCRNDPVIEIEFDGASRSWCSIHAEFAM